MLTDGFTAWSAGWTTKLVAQSCTLPYRRIVFCGASPSPSTLGLAGALPIGNRRYSRLKICATVLRSICRQSHGLHSSRTRRDRSVMPKSESRNPNYWTIQLRNRLRAPLPAVQK